MWSGGGCVPVAGRGTTPRRAGGPERHRVAVGGGRVRLPARGRGFRGRATGAGPCAGRRLRLSLHHRDPRGVPHGERRRVERPGRCWGPRPAPAPGRGGRSADQAPWWRGRPTIGSTSCGECAVTYAAVSVMRHT